MVVEEVAFEVIAILIPNFKVLIVSFYQLPKGNIHYLFDKLHEVLLSLHGVPYDLVLAGDLNLSLVE